MAYVGWITHVIRCHSPFLSFLAVERKVAASTRKRAMAALLYLDRAVLDRRIGEPGAVVRARRPDRLPVDLTRAGDTGELSTSERPVTLGRSGSPERSMMSAGEIIKMSSLFDYFAVRVAAGW